MPLLDDIESPSLPFPPDEKKANIELINPRDHSFELWYSVCISRDLYYCRNTGAFDLRHFFSASIVGFWLRRAHHQEKDTRRLCLDGVDETEIWRRHRNLPECSDVGFLHDPL